MQIKYAVAYMADDGVVMVFMVVLFKFRLIFFMFKRIFLWNWGYIRFTDHRGIVSPSIVEHTGHVSVAQDEGAVLLCIAQGCPAPEYR